MAIFFLPQKKKPTKYLANYGQCIGKGRDTNPGYGYGRRVRNVLGNLPGIEIEGIAQLSVVSGFFSDEKNSSSQNFHRLNRKDCIQS